MLIPLETVDELIEKLGGPAAVGRLVARAPSAVCQWRETIPPEHYTVMRAACAREGYDAPAHLFRCTRCGREPVAERAAM